MGPLSSKEMWLSQTRMVVSSPKKAKRHFVVVGNLPRNRSVTAHTNAASGTKTHKTRGNVCKNIKNTRIQKMQEVCHLFRNGKPLFITFLEVIHIGYVYKRLFMCFVYSCHQIKSRYVYFWLFRDLGIFGIGGFR